MSCVGLTADSVGFDYVKRRWGAWEVQSNDEQEYYSLGISSRAASM